MENSTLPECIPSSCAPCNIGANTMCISFPYQNVDKVTATVSVIPHVTLYDDGRLETTYSTITIEEHPDRDYFDEEFTWVTHGRTLTWPTTYGTLEGFVGRADETFVPTRKFYGDRDCDGTVGTTALTLPATIDPGLFIIPLGTASTTLKAAPLPQNIIDYLESFETVHEQLNNIPLTSCAPALPVRKACTTVLTSTSTIVSCATEADGRESCVTETATLVETDTHTPHWPTLNGSQTDLKVTAARLTTETGEATTVRATAEPALEPALEPSSDGLEDQPRTDANPDDDTPSSQGTSEPGFSGSQEQLPEPTEDPEATDAGSQGELGATTSTTMVTTTPTSPFGPATIESQMSNTAGGDGSGSTLAHETGSESGPAPQDSSGAAQPTRTTTDAADVATFTGDGSRISTMDAWAAFAMVAGGAVGLGL